MKKILFVFVFSLLIASCDNKPEHRESFPTDFYCFRFVNKSGVQVAIVVNRCDYDQGYFDFPDSLVILPDQVHTWDLYVYASMSTKMSPVYHPQPPLGDVRWLKLYFDETVCVPYEGYASEVKNPAVLSNYLETPSTDKKYKKTWTYTFTPEDYQRAVEQNKTEK